MKALFFRKAGSLDFLEVADAPRPVPAPGEALVKVRAAAINPSDAKNVLGRMHETTVPRVPGRDFAGVVEDGPAEWLGKAVFGSGGGLGFYRDGSHAEFLAAPIAGLNAMPANLTFEQAAGMGLAYITAWAAVMLAAKLQPGETILITGTTGAVGGAAAKIARETGARVIGTTRKAAEIPNLHDPAVDDWVGLDAGELSERIAAATDGKGANVVFDVVGGPMFEPCVKSLALRGRHVAIASNPEPRVSFNLVDFYHREGRILGVDSLKVSIEEAGEILRALTPGIEEGKFPPPAAIRTRGFSDVLEAYRLVNEGKAREKQILVP
jgi:NADPH:quinone reductase-like Zn-dependent oxidoreductase